MKIGFTVFVLSVAVRAATIHGSRRTLAKSSAMASGKIQMVSLRPYGIR